MSEYYFTKDELYHHGIKGQKWGQRRFQNPDGSLTPAGREHYGYGEARSKMLAAKSKYKSAYKDYSKSFDRAINLGAYVRPLTKKGRSEQSRREDDMIKKAQLSEKARQEYKQAKKEYKQSDEYKDRQAKLKKAAIIGVAVAGTALAAYGAYKVGKLKVDRANTIIEGRKLCAKHVAEGERKLYDQLSGYYQGKDRAPENRPINDLSDPYTKSLRRSMMKYQKNITEATKAYNEADRALKSSNFNKLKTAYKYSKGFRDAGTYDGLLERSNDWINRDRAKRSLYKSKDPVDVYLRRRDNKGR